MIDYALSTIVSFGAAVAWAVKGRPYLTLVFALASGSFLQLFLMEVYDDGIEEVSSAE